MLDQVKVYRAAFLGTLSMLLRMAQACRAGRHALGLPLDA